MEIETLNSQPFVIERVDNVSTLSNFYCGVDQMDKFIHKKDGLALYVESRLTTLWTISSENQVIAFFALSKSSIILNSEDVRNVKRESSDSLKELFDRIEAYPALRIDYLAIQKNIRHHKLGSIILSLIREKALSDNLSSTLFLIVDSLDTPDYSSVEFYRKNYFKESEYGIIRTQNLRREGIGIDTKLMYLPLFR